MNPLGCPPEFNRFKQKKQLPVIFLFSMYLYPMKTRFFAPSVAFCLTIFVACNPSDSPSKLETRLKQLEAEMMAPSGEIRDLKKANAFIATSETYAAALEKSNPALFGEVACRAAGLAVSISNPEKALSLYHAVAAKTPDHPKAPMALFMRGFVYENLLKDTSNARKAYEQVLEKYPRDTVFADDARNCLLLLGKSPEEIIREFEAKNRQQ